VSRGGQGKGGKKRPGAEMGEIVSCLDNLGSIGETLWHWCKREKCTLRQKREGHFGGRGLHRKERVGRGAKEEKCYAVGRWMRGF